MKVKIHVSFETSVVWNSSHFRSRCWRVAGLVDDQECSILGSLKHYFLDSYETYEKKFLRSLTDVKSWNKKKSLLVCNNGTFLFLLQIGGHMSKEGGVSNELFFLVYLFVYFLVWTKVHSIFTFFLNFALSRP